VLHLLGVEVGAVGVEAVGQPVHCAVHHLVDVHLLDVVVENQPQHVVEDAQVAVAVALCRGIAAQNPADDRECQHRQRHEENGGANSGRHGVGVNHCTGLTGRPSIRTSK
jgi:hypothetical protein